MADMFDYVIVGAGSAGCILANRLSADGQHSVCLLEAGPPDRNIYIHIPAGFIKNLDNSSINWMYQAESGPHINGRKMPVPRGKTLGGSSSINGMIYNRGQRLDYDHWAQLGNRGWGYADVLPYFKRCEARVGEGDDTYRGRAGGMTVETMPYRHPLCDAFIKGAAEIGIPLNPDYNGAKQEGISYVQRTVRGRRRVSTARAYLHPAKSRPNLTVITNAFATQILLEGKKAVGIAYNKGGKGGTPLEARANREVILSGGVINSPQLLQLSGIGPAGLLQDLGIAVQHELAGVGENLRDHYAPRFVVRVKNAETLNERARGLRRTWEIAKYLAGGKSIVNLNPSLVYGFWHSDPVARSSDLQFIFTPASYDEGKHGVLADWPGFTVAAWQHRPESSGYVRAKSADPFQKPAIQPNYLAHETDQRAVVAAMRLARSLIHSRAMAPYYDGEELPGEAVQSDDELLDAARRIGATTYHPMGTCRMSPATDPTAVVDDRLRVHGLEGLRVVDASVMPRMMSANLAAGTMMIAEKASDIILGKPALEPIITPD
ncbi:MAG: GMC family oxidoreductase N-terminal domain-containing protein [Alphaproteobacteria bacterium]|nr:GMC family oxidoreductase N-terminal domain-containing protein [Alphaproteobacteria bacterium]MCB9931238.1 GMC family oxidoreductase N-terminal domain-containing protein [Alphaproteobacteria bacterium]